jgi:putative transposase
VGRLLHSFLLMLAAATDKALARQVQYLKAENAILRAKLPRRVTVTPAERRRLLKYGKPLGSAIKDLVGIVSPRTFARWASGEVAGPKAARPARPGRPRTKEDVRELVLRLARETGWGYSRILGELKKLGVGKVCRSTVVNILRAAGLDPGPQRGEGSWDEFVQRHAKTLWACDFFSKKVWTRRGPVDVFVLFFLHVGSRRVFVTGLSTRPERAWVVQQARNFLLQVGEGGDRPCYLLRDYDGKFVPEFDALLESEGVTVKKVGPRSPNLNAYAERWVQTVRRECLDHFVVFGEDHLRHLVTTFADYYNRWRPHQSRDNRPLTGEPAPGAAVPVGAVTCEERLGGLLKHYVRAA